MHPSFKPGYDELACEQALRRAMAEGLERKENSVATTSLEFKHLYRKSRSQMPRAILWLLEMLIGGDDISNVVITLDTCFSMFVYICAYWRKSDSSVEFKLRLWNLNICIEKVDAKCLLAEMALVMTSLPLTRVFQYLFTFALIGGNLTAQ